MIDSETKVVRTRNLFHKIQDERSDHLDMSLDSNVLLVDGLNTFIRAWSANPTLNSGGEHVGGTIGFFKSVFHAIDKFMPSRVIVVFDGKNGSAKRKSLHSDYKKSRSKNKLSRVNRVYGQLDDDEERVRMKRQLVMCAEMMKELPISIMMYENTEADDVMAYLANELCPENVVLMSSDKDFLQLVNERIRVWSPTKKKIYDQDAILDEYGILSENFLLYRALDGDKSDSIDGVRGMGLKTLKTRFPIISERYTTVDDILEYAREHSVNNKIKIYNRLIESEDIVRLNLNLMSLQDVKINSNAKLDIINLFNKSRPRLDRLGFERKIRNYGLYDSIPNVQTWMQRFKILDSYVNNERTAR